MRKANGNCIHGTICNKKRQNDVEKTLIFSTILNVGCLKFPAIQVGGGRREDGGKHIASLSKPPRSDLIEIYTFLLSSLVFNDIDERLKIAEKD